MAEEKKKKSIKETLAELKGMGTSSEGFKKQAETSKQETLAASKNKKLSEPAKEKLKVQKQKDEEATASEALRRSRETVKALSTRATLKNYGGYSGPAETEGQVTNPAKPPAKPKPKPKPQPAAASAPRLQPTTSTKPKPRPAAGTQPSNTQMTSATSNLFIGKEAAESQSKFRPGSRPAKPKSSDYPPNEEGTRRYAAALRAWTKKYGK